MQSALDEAKRREADLQLRLEASERASAEQASVLMREKDDIAAQLSAAEAPQDVADLTQLLLSKTGDLDRLRERLVQSEKSRVDVSRLSESLHNQLTSARLVEADLTKKAESMAADHEQESADFQHRLAQLQSDLDAATRQAEMRQLSALLPLDVGAPRPFGRGGPTLASQSRLPVPPVHVLPDPRVTPTITPIVERNGLHR